MLEVTLELGFKKGCGCMGILLTTDSVLLPRDPTEGPVEGCPVFGYQEQSQASADRLSAGPPPSVFHFSSTVFDPALLSCLSS